MSQLRHGARQALDNLESDLLYIKEMAYNPHAIEALADKCLRRLREEIEPRLQRAEPTLEQRLNESIAQQLEAMEELRERLARVEAQKIIVIKE